MYYRHIRSCCRRAPDRTRAATPRMMAPLPESNPFLARAILLRAWLAIAAPAEARAFLVRHAAMLRDPRSIALLTGWARQVDDATLAGELRRRRDALLGIPPNV
jgi:hypothetical protein